MRYLLSIGSNAPGQRQFMEQARQWLDENFANVVSSGIYSSPALNGSAADYLNLVARGDSELSPTDLTAAAKAFERQLGRTPLSKQRGAIEIDIDIIAAGPTILRPAEYTRSYFLRGLSLLEEREE